MHFELAFVTLFSIATGVALVARFLRIPYTIALVLAGLSIGTVHAFEPPHLTKELLYAVFLPGLIFEAAFHLEFGKFWQNKLAIHVLAIPGVMLAIALTTLLFYPAAHALHLEDGLDVKQALVFAALIAATDPIAVVALFKRLGAPKRLTLLIEGESLLNDGTAVVLFMQILSFATGNDLSLPAALLNFCLVVGLGALVGSTIGFAASKLIQRVNEPMIEITLTTIAAYGSFLLAEYFHASGIIATVAAGMVCGNYAFRAGMSPSSRMAVESFWEYVAFALNSIVFLLIGFEVQVKELARSWSAILVAYLAVTLARAAIVYLATLLLRRTRERMPWSWSAVLTWGGLRGSLSMVLVLALPASLPSRHLLVTITFGVVILSILIQGLTISPLLRWLQVVGTKENCADYEIQRGMVRAKSAALAELETLQKSGVIHSDAADLLAQEYSAAVQDAEQRIRNLYLHSANLQQEDLRAARRQLLLIERSTAQESFHKGLIGSEALAHLVSDIDARLQGLEATAE